MLHVWYLQIDLQIIHHVKQKSERLGSGNAKYCGPDTIIIIANWTLMSQITINQAEVFLLFGKYRQPDFG